MEQRVCNGDGMCLHQDGSINGYHKSNDVSCSHNCQPVKCPNYIICNDISPQWYLWCHGGTCANCAMTFGANHSWKGQLHFQDDTECCICLDTKLCVKGVNCNHYTCVDCFKRCHRPPYWEDPQPQFPYDSELEDEYDSQWEYPRWRNDPLIQKYEEDLKKWEDDRNERDENEAYLRKCSVCRQ